MLRTKLVTVPPPGLLEGRVRELVQAELRGQGAQTGQSGQTANPVKPGSRGSPDSREHNRGRRPWTSSSASSFRKFLLASCSPMGRVAEAQFALDKMSSLIALSMSGVSSGDRRGGDWIVVPGDNRVLFSEALSLLELGFTPHFINSSTRSWKLKCPSA